MTHATTPDDPTARPSRMHDALAGFVSRGELPGLIALVARRGTAEVEVIGATTAGGSQPLRRDSIFRISSMTKPITAAAAMALIDDGKLTLDEPVDRLLPELAHRRVLRRLDGPLDDTVPANQPITVRDLLAFTMGMGILFAPPGATPIQRAIDELALGQGPPQPEIPPAPDEWLRRLGTLPLMRQPGECWMYNTGSDVLGALIARAAGRPLEAFLRERLLEPLGMHDTGFSVTPAQRDRLVTSYLTEPTGGLRLFDPPDGQWSRPPAFPAGGAGLVSTADDFLAFAELLRNGGSHRGTRLLSAASVAAMTRDQLTPAQKAASTWVPGFFDRFGWGLGMAVVTGTDDSAAPGSYGWDGGLGTTWRTDPRTDTVTILLTQRAWAAPEPPPVCRAFWRAARTAE
jgi:CubicO group peptidase (beta-lactamase class C family)